MPVKGFVTGLLTIGLLGAVLALGIVGATAFLAGSSRTIRSITIKRFRRSKLALAGTSGFAEPPLFGPRSGPETLPAFTRPRARKVGGPPAERPAPALPRAPARAPMSFEEMLARLERKMGPVEAIDTDEVPLLRALVQGPRRESGPPLPTQVPESAYVHAPLTFVRGIGRTRSRELASTGAGNETAPSGVSEAAWPSPTRSIEARPTVKEARPTVKVAALSTGANSGGRVTVTLSEEGIERSDELDEAKAPHATVKDPSGEAEAASSRPPEPPVGEASEPPEPAPATASDPEEPAESPSETESTQSSRSSPGGASDAPAPALDTATPPALPSEDDQPADPAPARRARRQVSRRAEAGATTAAERASAQRRKAVPPEEIGIILVDEEGRPILD